MLHGVPAPCPKCGGRTEYRDGRYECTAWADEYARCQFKATTHDRKGFLMPTPTGNVYLDGFIFVKVGVAPKPLYSVGVVQG